MLIQPWVTVQAKHAVNFTHAKKLARIIHQDHRYTFYCNCRYDKHLKINLKSCGYPIQKDIRRAERLEWEHIVPVSLWGRKMACWHNASYCHKFKCHKGRKGCRGNKLFSKMEADLHNIVPEIGELNALRSNYEFGMLPNITKNKFGACLIKIDYQNKVVEPAPRVRGMIARAYLYMAEIYRVELSEYQLQLYKSWNLQYPPSVWEREWDNRVARIQGNHNHYIYNYSMKAYE